MSPVAHNSQSTGCERRQSRIDRHDLFADLVLQLRLHMQSFSAGRRHVSLQTGRYARPQVMVGPLGRCKAAE